ncbi:MAG TPA: hypothetical protein VE779_17855 [Candidatus Angelobacter sp.]|nr:hypothetical protein [Candidatus Angelobacter sp.]
MPYLLAAAISILVLNSVYKLGHADLRIPLVDAGDATFYDSVVKNFVENGGYNLNPLLGAPGHQEMYDFPITHITHFLGFAILRLFTRNYGLVINLYYLLTYPLIAITSLYAFRRLGVSLGLGIAGGILFAFLPYHLLRSEGHLVLSSYYLVPLTVLAAVWVAHGHPLFRFDEQTNAHKRAPLITRDGVLALVACALVGADNPYWAFFSGVFLGVAGLLGRFRYGHRRALYSSWILGAVIVATFGMNLLPYALYASKHGLNPINHRSPAEAEVYGGRITQLVLPVTRHRIAALAKWKATYNAGAPLVNENDTATLGLVGAIGFICLFASFYSKPLDDLFDSLSVLNLTAVLLFTMGGLGALFSFSVWTQIRGYNRMSVYIGFFSIFAFVLIAQHLLAGVSGRSGMYLRSGLVPLAMLGIGLPDQIPVHFVPNRAAVEKAYRQDGDFVRTIESVAGAHSMIFELPYAAFPGQAPSNTDMQGFDELKGYLHSSSLRWSGGAMIGRPDDLWIRHISGEPADQMVAAIMAAGFSGIWIDRYGYADHGGSIESQIQKVLGREPLVSENGRRSFFLLGGAKQESGSPAPVLPFTRTPGVPYVTVSAGKGCGPLERTPQSSWHSCDASAQIVISNESDRVVAVDLTAKIVTGDHNLSRFSVVGPNLSRQLEVNDEGTTIQMDVLAGHGESIVKLQSEAKPLVAGDSRTAVFRLADLTSAVTYSPGKAGQ